MKYRIVGANEFGRFRALWGEINGSQGDQIVLDPVMVDALVTHFADRGTLLGVCEDSENPMMALLSKGRGGFWLTFQPSQSPLGLIVGASRSSAVAQTGTLLRSLPGFALGLGVLQQDPDFSVYQDLDRHGNVDTLDYIETPRISVSGSFDQFWKEKSRNFKHNLARRRRRLGDDGLTPALVMDNEPEAVARCIEDYGRLEQSGWKGRQGTAVTVDNSQGRFYREILEKFCEKGEGIIYRLMINEKAAAADLCVERNGVMIILKTAYDENLKQFSPGQMLHQEIFQRVFSEARIKTVEFYGRALDWHRKWTDEVRTLYHVNVYRNSLVRTTRRLALAASEARRKTRDRETAPGSRDPRRANTGSAETTRSAVN